MIAVAQHTEQINQLTNNDLDSQVNTIKINVTKLQNDMSETMIAVAQHTEQINQLTNIDTDFNLPNITATFPSDFTNPTACIAILDLSNNDNIRGLFTRYINKYHPVFSSSILMTIILDCNISSTTDRIITFNKLPFTLSVMTINDNPIYCFKATSNIDLDAYGWTPDHHEKFDFILEYNTYYNSIYLYINLTTYAII